MTLPLFVSTPAVEPFSIYDLSYRSFSDGTFTPYFVLNTEAPFIAPTTTPTVGNALIDNTWEIYFGEYVAWPETKLTSAMFSSAIPVKCVTINSPNISVITGPVSAPLVTANDLYCACQSLTVATSSLVTLTGSSTTIEFAGGVTLGALWSNVSIGGETSRFGIVSPTRPVETNVSSKVEVATCNHAACQTLKVNGSTYTRQTITDISVFPTRTYKLLVKS